MVTLITMATASPPFLGAYAWIILLGRYGVVNKIIKALTGVQPTWGFYGGNRCHLGHHLDGLSP